jgi:dihydroxyacid dehydratase/phosphogluconate dehydratase
VPTGDVISLDVPNRRIDLEVAEDELARRRAEWKTPPQKFGRGYGVIMSRHITQADKGCDFDFLSGTAPTPEPEIH